MMQFQSLKAKGSNVRGEASSYFVATVSQRMDNSEAYAELFAAAPDMLAALKEAQNWLVAIVDANSIADADRDILEHVDAAIAKAEGR